MREFDLIRRLQEIIEVPGARYADRCVLGIGDDAAVMDVPPSARLVACTDSLVEGVHFPVGASPAAIGHKALAVNLSDLAAMGADPAWFLLSLTAPHSEPEWLDAFARGMARLATETGVLLAGGDVSSGPFNICVTALGLVEPGREIRRSGARAGDRVVVSGRLGGAAHALQAIRTGAQPDARDLAALEFPAPRLVLGRALRGLATACIDISDGLLADLGHILEASGAGAELELHRVTSPPSMASLPERQRWPLQLSGGDDYELCFTLPPAAVDRLESLARTTRTELTVIGSITAVAGLTVREPDGALYDPPQAGYEHFGDTGNGSG